MATFEPSQDLDPTVAQAIQDAMDALRAELLGRLEAQERPAPLGDSGGDRLNRLEGAVETLDSATSQTDLLSRFIQQAGAFADRSLFLVRDGEDLNGWAAFGFSAGDEDVAQVSVTCPSAVAAGEPDDDPAAGAAICDQLAAIPPAEGLMVPFALRGKVAGALYVDRTTPEGELDRPALRILSYVAAQAVETLPLRRGEAAAAPAEAEPAEPPAQEPVPAVVEEAADEPMEEPAEKFDEPASETLEVAEVAAQEADERTDPEVEVDVERMIEEVEPDTTGEQEASDIVAIRQGVTPADFQTVEEVGAAAEQADDEDDEFDTGTYDTAIEDIERQELEPATTETPEPVAESATVETPTERAAEAPPRVVEDAEVAPPEDLDGPGWAFSGTEKLSEDSRHEEARRLARLLVTEIKLYNEEKVREGRENSDLYDQLRDDIERSRRIYEERIDDEIRDEGDYFQDEVVRILAGGDSTALGA